jgi:two-component sensor histidine kinase
VHELCSNAVEHGAFGLSEGAVDVAWGVTRESAHAADALMLVWKEREGSLVTPPTRRGFGMQVLTEMLSYELGGAVALAFEADGLRCTLRCPLVPRIGRLFEAQRGDGTADPE